MHDPYRLRLKHVSARIISLSICLCLLVLAAAWIVGDLERIHLTQRLGLAIIVVQPLLAASNLCAAWRIRVLSRLRVHLWDAFKAITLTNSFLFVVPSRLSDLLKPLYLLEKSNLPLTTGVAIVAFERIIDIVVVAIGVSILALILAGRGMGAALQVWLALASIAILGALCVLYRPQYIAGLLQLLPAGRPRAVMLGLLQSVSSAVAPRDIPRATVFAVAAWVLSWAVFHVFLMLVGNGPIALDCSLAVFLAASIGLATAVAPGGLGTFEAAVVVALGWYGYPVAEALSFAIGLHIASLGYQLPLSLGLGIRGDISLNEFVRKAKELVNRRPSA